MSGQSSSQSGGIGIGGALLVLFIGLKLGGVINWSWWWVMAPLWVPLPLAIVLTVVLIIGWGIAQLVKR